MANLTAFKFLKRIKAFNPMKGLDDQASPNNGVDLVTSPKGDDLRGRGGAGRGAVHLMPEDLKSDLKGAFL